MTIEDKIITEKIPCFNSRVIVNQATNYIPNFYYCTLSDNAFKLCQKAKNKELYTQCEFYKSTYPIK